MFTRTFENRIGGRTTKVAKNATQLWIITASMLRMGWTPLPADGQAEVGHAAFGPSWQAAEIITRSA